MTTSADTSNFDSILGRAYLLFEQSRYAQAEQEVRRVLSSQPHDAEAQALLALCLVRQEQFSPATEAAEQAIALSPDWSFAHYALAVVLYERQRLLEAEQAIATALHLNPVSDGYWATQAAILCDQDRWAESLTAAERGLQLNPENSTCLNLRAILLVKLNRVQEAADSVQAALQQDPEDATAHANQGWLLLEQGRAAAALPYFREALRLDPQLEWARRGIVAALKAHNPLYGLMLRYFLWMGKLTPAVRWGIVLGGWFLMRSLHRLSRLQPDLKVWITPVLVAYVLFVYFTWIADPLFNLMLRLDRYGRLVLSRDEIAASNGVAGLLSGAILSLATGLIFQVNTLLLGSFILALLVIPTTAIFSCDPGGPRRTMRRYAIALALLGSVGFLVSLVQGSPDGLAVIPLMLFLLGVLSSSFVANFLIHKTQQR